MRGKAWLLYHRGELFRITPAYAGKSADRQVVIVRQWDHPRLCGEKPALAGATRCISGSPPPMRGKVDQQSMLCSCKGITPAYAGKSPLFQNVRQCIEDHPRLCGEKADTAQNLANSAGSPPPMRGKGCFSGSLAP